MAGVQPEAGPAVNDLVARVERAVAEEIGRVLNAARGHDRPAPTGVEVAGLAVDVALTAPDGAVTRLRLASGTEA